MVIYMRRTLDGAFPSKYLTAADVEGKRFSAVVKAVNYEMMTDGTQKPVVLFEGLRKSVVLNKTRAKFLATLAKSKKFDDWIGQSVDICGGMTSLRGEDVTCIKFEKTAAAKKAEVKDLLDDDLPDNLKGDDDYDDL